jgi:tRNA uridine 5-carboxymethylaminomethyl modification enzyme
MIDDLTTLSTTEPDRMFTSRAEYRLALREDNARDRLSDTAHKYGLISDHEHQAFCELREDTDHVVALLRETRVKVAEIGALADRFEKAEVVSLEQLLKLPGVTSDEIRPILPIGAKSIAENNEAFVRAAITIRYQGYIEKQQREIDKFRKMESEEIPETFRYEDLSGLKNEAREKFHRFRPRSLGQAGRIEGVTPGDVAVLSVHLKRYRESS